MKRGQQKQSKRESSIPEYSLVITAQWNTFEVTKTECEIPVFLKTTGTLNLQFWSYYQMISKLYSKIANFQEMPHLLTKFFHSAESLWKTLKFEKSQKLVLKG